MSLDRGTIVAGRYRILERVGQGSGAEIYRAEETDGSHRIVAVEILRGDVPAEDAARHFARLQALEDPALAPVLGHGRLEGGGAAFVVSEWIDGADFLEAARLLSSSELCAVLQQVCRGLDTLHRNDLLHGDLRPANLRVTRRKVAGDEALRVRVLGYGLGRLRGAPADPDREALVYAAPEMLRSGRVDGRADLYALGVILHEAITGAPPFDGTDPAAVLRGHLEETPRPIDPSLAGVPSDLAALVTRLLMKDPADRFPSAAEVGSVVAAIGPGGSPAPGSTGLTSRDLGAPALVGRERDLAALASFVDAHHRGEGAAGMALLLGEGGIGKSRLLAELARLAAARGLLVHHGFCHETGGAPFGAFLEVLQWAVRTAEREGLRPASEDERPNGDLIDRYGPEVVKVVPGAFASRAVVPSEQLLPRHERLRLIDAIGTFLLEVSLARPYVLAIEDLHWADDASADLVDYLLRNRGRGRLAMAASARPSETRAAWLREGLEREAGPEAVTRLSLGRLTEEEVGALLQASLGFAVPPPELAARVQRDAGGNPFFVVEMLRDLAEDGVLARRDGRWICDEPALRRREPSSSITQALERRVARATAEELLLLRALAILDRNIDLEILGCVVTVSAGKAAVAPETVSTTLEAAIDRGLVARCSGEESVPLFAIAHDTARELLVRGIDEGTRHVLHRAAGAALEARHGTDSEDGIERIAYHFIQAGDDERSARYCMRAAQKARRLQATDDATYFYLQALKYHSAPDDPCRWEALRCLGEVYIVQGRPTHARPRYEELRRLGEGAGNAQATGEGYLGLADCSRRLSDYATQMRFARAAFQIGLRSGLRIVQTNALQSLGIGHYNLGNIAKATRCYSLALASIPPSGSEALRGLTLNRLGLAYLAQGDSTRAQELFTRALELAETHKLTMLASLNNNLGCAAEKEARYDEALAYYSRTEAIGGQRGERYNQALAWLNQAGVYLKLNDLPAAEHLAKKTTKIAIEFGDRLLQGYATVYCAQIHRARGETTDAAEYVEDAWRGASQTGHREIRLLAELERSKILLDKGELDAAATLAASVREEATRHMIRESAAYAAVWEAEAYRRQHALSNGAEALAVAWSLLADGAFPEAEWRAHLVSGKLLDEKGASSEADEHYRAGTAIVESLAGAIKNSALRDNYLRESLRMEMRVKGARALARRRKSDECGQWASHRGGHEPTSVVLIEQCRVLSGLRTVEDVCKLLLTSAMRATGAQHAAIVRSDCTSGTQPSRDQFVSVLASPAAFRPCSDLIARACDGEPAAYGLHTGHDGCLPPAREFADQRGYAVPIPSASGVWGVLYVENPASQSVGLRLLAQLQALAAQAGLVIGGLAGRLSSVVVAPPRHESFGELSSVSSSMLEPFAALRGIAPTIAPVLLEGESGTGKELAARAIHDASPRREGPFVAIDCGAIPESLADAELFGCLKGAFSGASEPRTGLIATSHGGTLFLDEVENMPLALQAKVLRVLQTGEVRAVGAAKARTVDFRLVSATNSDLAADVRAGRFRRDLFYRLVGLLVRLPPLRERREDIAHLTIKLLGNRDENCERGAEVLSRDALSRLVGHDWPGNVRELRHVISAARTFAGDGPILQDHVARALQPTSHLLGGRAMDAEREADLQALTQALTATQGDKTAAARRLGWSRMRVYRMLRRSTEAVGSRPQ